MITNKVFDNEKQLNEFVSSNQVGVISINRIKVTVDSGLPSAHGGSYFYDENKIELWYSIMPPLFPKDRDTKNMCYA